MSEPQTIDKIATHPNGCPCKRCEGLEPCPVCDQQKLDIDWCFSCRRLVLMHGLWVHRPVITTSQPPSITGHQAARR